MTKYAIIILAAALLVGCSGFTTSDEPVITTTNASGMTLDADANILNVLDEAGCDFQAVEISDGKKRQHHLAVVCK